MALSDYKQFELAPLESFDPVVFQPSDKEQKRVAGFVLALALSHNDLGDVAAVWGLLLKQEPPKPFRPTPAVGQYFGILHHLHRQYIALLFAFFDCINDNQDLLHQAVFEKVIQQMNREVRICWQSLVEFALHGTASNPTLKVLTRVRNCVTFHYDPKELQKGFEARLNAPIAEEWKTAYISRGDTAGRTRYHFADGAAQQYFNGLGVGGPMEDFWKQVIDITVQIQNAVEQIVLHFVQLNGGAWQEVRLK
jgi:hypothetical protein